ncbi:MAG: dolichyl-phosphate-mannose--protein mannosyltransferase [Pseudozobellia sp.]|nr:dolichyl-phosphate-mannose--protein mannosyltransferase [Pseudozobellia sp.]MBG49812.1 dolichyl-phosphate-mannose--protein mannosyltransferase [Pseudozobellia sp.]|tara:strand:- start:8676 stop:10325 length:1650 start_codon:yes stop_codon:yes gene_type:complete
MISNSRYWVLIILVVLVYITGMFVTLFENDSAQFAVMAMRMVQENDFLNLFKGTEEYLDKPHLHYWLAAFSYLLFGIEDWAYRIPGILALLLGAYSTYGLGNLLYDKRVGKVAALIFMTAQTIVLSAIDVRTDAVLTGFVILAIWQLALYANTGSIKSILLGGIAAGLAFSTKGQLAILIIGLALLSHLIYTRNWKALINWKVLLGLLTFAIAITPMLYAYYHQFDLHPEKVLRGKAERSGIFFIFWEQSFERLSGEGMGSNSSDYFFFFHTFLWVFLPWTVLGIMAYARKINSLFKLKFKWVQGQEMLTIGGITFFFLIASFSQFKLPHYLNSIIPLFAVLTATYIVNLKNEKTGRILLGVQYFVLSIIFIAAVLICFLVFEFDNLFALGLLLVFLLTIIYFCLKSEQYDKKIITLTVFGSLLLNATLNLHFYPNLLTYQAGSSMAKVVKEREVPVDNIYKLGDFHTWSFDFYNRKPLKITSYNAIRGKKDFWVYANDDQLRELKELDFDWDIQYTRAHYRITRLSLKFLNPSKRKKSLDKMHLVHIY